MDKNRVVEQEAAPAAVVSAHSTGYPGDMEKPLSQPETTPPQEELLDAKTCLIAGAGIGAFGAASALTAGAVCPLCLIATPALLGLGAYKHYRSKHGQKEGGA
jgi:hypothetical protein